MAKTFCDKCDGSGRILQMGIEFVYCPDCLGKGWVEKDEETESDKPTSVIEVKPAEVKVNEVKPQSVKPKQINLLTHYPCGQKRLKPKSNKT
jgi:DnaJ-class molecular chaperone